MTDAVPPPTASLPIDAAARCDAPDKIAWRKPADVLVVGFGAEARRQHHREGGWIQGRHRRAFRRWRASTKSGGVVYAGGGTRINQPATRTLRRRCSTICAWKSATPSLSRRCANLRGQRGLLSWLESIGAAFGIQRAAPKTSS